MRTHSQLVVFNILSESIDKCPHLSKAQWIQHIPITRRTIILRYSLMVHTHLKPKPMDSSENYLFLIYEVLVECCTTNLSSGIIFNWACKGAIKSLLVHISFKDTTSFFRIEALDVRSSSHSAT